MTTMNKTTAETMTTKYVNMTVVVNDPEERLKDGETISVKLTYDAQTQTMTIDVPEARKPKAKEQKPQPNNLYTGVLTGIKGTITVSGNAKLNMDLKPEKVDALGKRVIKGELDEAFNMVMNFMTGQTA